MQKDAEPALKEYARLQGEHNLAANAWAKADNAARQAQNIIAGINNRLKFANGPQIGQWKAKREAQNRILGNAQQVGGNAQRRMAELAPSIGAQEAILAPIDANIRNAWHKLEECRNQWCDIMQPDIKYARGDYKVLREALDRWLLTDGLWQNALVWASLCAYEMNDFRLATNYIEKAEELRKKVVFFHRPRPLPVVSVMLAILTKNQPGADPRNAGKAAEKEIDVIERKLRSLARGKNKRSASEICFILARYHVEEENHHKKAKSYYEKALRFDPSCLCSKIGLAQLQVASKKDGVRDVKAGLEPLERLWNKCDSHPWRLANYLCAGYDAATKSNEADEMFRFVMTSSATNEQKEQSRKDREDRLKRLANRP